MPAAGAFPGRVSHGPAFFSPTYSELLARIGTYQWGGKKCGYEMDNWNFSGLDKFMVLRNINP
jgi:hypothetical protein